MLGASKLNSVTFQAVVDLGGFTEHASLGDLSRDTMRKHPEQIEAESALRESEVRFRELADNISQFAWTADEAGWIYWYNKRWLDYTGRTLEEMQGWGWQKVHHPDHVDRVVHRIRQSFESGTPWEDTFPLRGRDGSYRWFLSRALPIRNEAGYVVRWFGTNTDITEQIELQNALRETTEDLRQRSIDLQAARDRAVLTAKATTGFLATVSHDIRQPLQAMALQLGVLGNEVSTPGGKRQLLMLERSLDSAMELLDFLLEYIKLDAGALEPRVATVGISSLLELLSDTFTVVAAQRGIRLTLLPTTLGTRSDPQLLARILRNFVSNAIKYTDRGGVLVGCRRRGDNVRIEVWDTGCGIPTEHQRQIFWEFVQVKESGRQHGGLGLGLAIVDRLAKLLGHRVEVRSRPGRGSVFAVEVPLVSAASAAPRDVVSTPASSEPLASKLIALIDDEASVSEAMAELLRSWGATPVCASSGEELLRALSGRKPDAVIADRNLGRGGDGFVVLSELEKQLGGALPSLILTGQYDLTSQQQANRAGRRVLHKPVWGDTLLAALCFELSRSGQV